MAESFREAPEQVVFHVVTVDAQALTQVEAKYWLSIHKE
jgi:hypothetical protein